jgi:peptidoglycan hydrolase CwlO-like protein
LAAFDVTPEANRNRLLAIVCALVFGGLTIPHAVAQSNNSQETLSSYQAKIDELQSQIDELQDSVDKNLEDAQRFDQNADQWEQTCANIRGYCMYSLYIVNSRATAEADRQNAAKARDQIRALQREVRALQRKMNESQSQ